MIDYKILSTGSAGNAVIIDSDILIDVGVPWKTLRNQYSKLKLVLLTHIHGDHFNKRTIKKLASERPTLRFGTPMWLVPHVVECGVNKRNIDVYDMDEEYIYADMSVTPFRLFHNVENCGYKIHTGDYYNPRKIIYATDTNSLDGIRAKGYDLYMIEANYTEDEIEQRIRKKQSEGTYCYEYDVLKNHLSREKADEWLYENIDTSSMCVYLHEHTDK